MNIYETKFTQISKWQQKLMEVKDVDILLENILSAARDILNADAGSIYEYDEESDKLRIKYSQTDTLQKKLKKGEKLPYTSITFDAKNTMAGYCAKTKKTINIPDVYKMDENQNSDKENACPYTFNDYTDKITGYHTKSMLMIPLVMANGKVHGVLQLINAMDENGTVVPFDKDAEFYILHFATQLGKVYDYAYMTKQLIERLCRAASYRDPLETGLHVERVSNFSVEIYDRYASKNDIPEKERTKFRDNLKLASKCHDVGKIAVPDKILKKPGKLDDDERAIMKGHTCVGAQLFTPVETELDELARDICLHHHDRYDGDKKGYPGVCEEYMSYEPGTPVSSVQQTLKGKDIPLGARIVAIADVYDALRHRRAYKEPWPAEKVFEIMKEESGHQFDPDLIQCFMEIKDRLEAISSSLS